MLLEALKVIDAASFLAAPGAATVLADYGADVIKVEPPQGDSYRGLAAHYHVDYNWQLTSRNKRSIALDLNQAPARAILHDLVDQADVLLVNFMPAQLERYELDYERLKARNPRLIYAHFSAYGRRGAEAGRRGFDTTGWWARSGLMDHVRDPGQMPLMGAPGFGDHASAMALFGAIMLALYRRERTGEGSLVESSLAANGAWANGMQLQGRIAGFDMSERRQSGAWASPFTAVYGTADDRHLLLAIVNPGREWPGLARALDGQGWLEDDRFRDLRTILKHRGELKALVAERIAALTLEEACARLDGEDVTYSVVARLEDVVADPQLRANGIVVDTGSDDPSYPVTIASPLQLAEEPKRPPGPAPAVGQHSREILAELGWDEARIEAALTAGVVTEGRPQ